MSIRSVTLVYKLTILAVVLIAWFFLAGCGDNAYSVENCIVAAAEAERYKRLAATREYTLNEDERRYWRQARTKVLRCEHRHSLGN